ncbi:MAG TPA: PilN domain-containing protein [Terriglobales bacterium]
MIRINLLGTPRQKKGKRGGTAAPVSIPSDGPPILVVLLVIALLAAGGNYGYYRILNSKHEKLQTDLASADAQIKTLSAVKTAYLEKQKQHEALKARFDVIDQLRANQAGPVTLLATIASTVNNSEAVWLNTMHDDGPSVTLEGFALSNVSLANLMENLRKTGQFKTVEVRETVQEDFAKDIQTFSFTLVCEKQKAKA